MKNSLRIVALMVALVLAIAFTGCSSTKPTEPTDGTSTQATPLKIGTLSTDDLFPLWVAEQEGYLTDAGLDVEIITFQSAQEQIAAMTSGSIDAMMTDMLVTAQLTAGGTPLKVVNRIAPARIGVVSGPGTNITTLEQLANVPIGASSPTIVEFIADKSLLAAGVSASEIKYESIPKVPVRFEMLMSGKVKAAGLPWSFCGLAASKGGTILVSEKDAGQLTSTVLAVSEKWLANNDADATVATLLTEWDKGVDLVNADPQKYLPLLVEKANLPAEAAANYPVATYEKAQMPDPAQVTDIMDWMVAKGYLKAAISYEDYTHDVK